MISVLEKFHQKELISHFSSLPSSKQKKLEEELQKFDLASYFSSLEKVQKEGTESEGALPLSILKKQERDSLKLYEKGKEALQKGKLAFFVVAGGQGSRLGFEHPKGLFPIGPVTGRSLFAFHMEKALHYGRYYGFEPFFLIMTSQGNHQETLNYLEEHSYFGLKKENVKVFPQRELPCVSVEGKLLLKEETSFFTAPDGHGGSLHALWSSGSLDFLEEKGVEYLSYFQVDNPLVNICDAEFLGAHLEKGADISTKVLKKRDFSEKLGHPAFLKGKHTIIEYSDMPLSLAKAQDEHGELLFGYGSIGIHLFNLSFLREIDQKGSLPFHKAQKEILAWNPQKREKEKVSGIKIEQFVFDAIPFTLKNVFFECMREEEFAPLKNATGEDSLETCQKGISAMYRSWLSSSLGFFDSSLEILPSYAVCREEFLEKEVKKPVSILFS